MEKKTYAYFMRAAEGLRYLLWNNVRGARRLAYMVVGDTMSHALGTRPRVILEARTTVGPLTVAAWYGPYESCTVASAVDYAEHMGMPFKNKIHAANAWHKLRAALTDALGAAPSEVTLWSAWVDQVQRRIHDRDSQPAPDA